MSFAVAFFYELSFLGLGLSHSNDKGLKLPCLRCMAHEMFFYLDFLLGPWRHLAVAVLHSGVIVGFEIPGH